MCILFIPTYMYNNTIYLRVIYNNKSSFYLYLCIYKYVLQYSFEVGPRDLINLLMRTSRCPLYTRILCTIYVRRD